MGFYFRKSVGFGPIRFNFSNSGVSYSVGVKGARVTFGKRGTYVSLGANGIYYRRKISTAPKQQQDSVPDLYITPSQDLHTITSGDVEQITDTDSQDFIDELTEKGKKISYFDYFGIIPLIITFVTFFMIFFQKETRQIVTTPEVKVFVENLSASNIKVRESAEKQGRVLGVIASGSQLELIEEGNRDWYKIRYEGQYGYVAKVLVKKKSITTYRETYSPEIARTLIEKHPIIFTLILLVLSGGFTILLIYLKELDKERLLIEIYYEIDHGFNQVYQKFVDHFSELQKCQMVWQYIHSENTNDYKYTGGASTNITRKSVRKISQNQMPSRIFKTNVQIPYLGLINTDLYFFPERLIIKRDNQFGAIMYKNIVINSRSTRFIEAQSVPVDAIIVDYTWQYLNKKGGPDKRFKDNRQLPICAYSEYTFNSSSGLNEVIATSKAGGIDQFVEFIKSIGNLQKLIPIMGKNNSNLN